MYYTYKNINFPIINEYANIKSSFKKHNNDLIRFLQKEYDYSYNLNQINYMYIMELLYHTFMVIDPTYDDYILVKSMVDLLFVQDISMDEVENIIDNLNISNEKQDIYFSLLKDYIESIQRFKVHKKKILGM